MYSPKQLTEKSRNEGTDIYVSVRFAGQGGGFRRITAVNQREKWAELRTKRRANLHMCECALTADAV